MSPGYHFGSKLRMSAYMGDRTPASTFDVARASSPKALFPTATRATALWCHGDAKTHRKEERALSVDIEERVIRVIAEAQQIDPGKITPCSTFAELGIDSFDGINVLFAIESEFDISVGDEEAKQLRSVAEAVENVERLLREKQ